VEIFTRVNESPIKFDSFQAYTYGLCGPLKLSPSDAVITDQSYNGGFMSGRIASIFVSQLIR
jgi:hypothetical protein